MIPARWLTRRQPYWKQLEALLDAAERRGVAALRHTDLRELGLLYRQTAADLSLVREDPAERRLESYLNQLLSRAHNAMYSGRRRDARGFVGFYRDTFPPIFRATIGYTGLAFVLFAAAALAGAALSLGDPSFVRRIIGPAMVATIERREMWTHSIVAVKPYASSLIMTNNLLVTFMAFALGITVVGTPALIVLNGLMIGVIGAACWRAGMSGALWSFVAPHGVLELPAIFIAGGAGLLVARGLMFPGLGRRSVALREAGNAGVRLLLGTVPLLVVAGIVEGFFSPSSAPASLKFLFAGGLAVVFAFYLMSGRASGGGGAIDQIRPRSLISRY